MLAIQQRISVNNLSKKISVLLPTRGRTDSLLRSVMSLITNSTAPEQVEFLLAFDNDDVESFAWFQENIAPAINSAGSVYACYGYEPIGYIRLNEYVNSLAEHADGEWLLFWNDDAVMQTAGWDQVISAHTEFAVLRMPSHNQHPYAIFPIVPRQWLDICGYLSKHQLSDAWISQIAYLLDIMVDVPIKVLHDRYDITGNNNDLTYKKRHMLEGNDNNPDDFNHATHLRTRLSDAVKIATALKARGREMKWFEHALTGQQDPWAKMTDAKHDPNKQLTSYKKL
jgi:hypothetical protein